MARPAADGEHNAIEYTRQLRRQVRNLVDPLMMSDNHFRKVYRLTKPLFTILMAQLGPYLRHDDEVLAVPNTIKVLSVLSFYASGSYQAQVSQNWMNCLGRSTVGRYIEEVTNALNEPTIQRRWIKFPQTRAERDRLTERHQRQCRMPGVLGCIDGTEITITTPPLDQNPQSFWTRKRQYALNCQIVCDLSLLILNANPSHPGAVNDAFIYGRTAVRRKMREAYEENPSCWLLGDSAYPSEPWLLIPILDAEPGSPEEFYTQTHCKMRNCVERCIGVLKGRFRCLLRDRALHYKPIKAAKIVKACCVLHNICRRGGVPDGDIAVNVNEEEPRPWVMNEAEAQFEALENEDDPDPALVVQGHERDHLREVGLLVRQRVVDFLNIIRHEEV